ncbi:hypothetical protein K466DRAFT_607459 [Polyporus arcularius HHB13444]|uniref:Uncharacterized protein n=1 Tax=Polyporus arcularius HHB13444 TaxID=1314778 RepID=A0A5C3NMT2_9APHY|nr:hypothetical protein K466DRAFT_607459 [Polyporus arcularius HHB13444]
MLPTLDVGAGLGVRVVTSTSAEAADKSLSSATARPDVDVDRRGTYAEDVRVDCGVCIRPETSVDTSDSASDGVARDRAEAVVDGQPATIEPYALSKADGVVDHAAGLRGGGGGSGA